MRYLLSAVRDEIERERAVLKRHPLRWHVHDRARSAREADLLLSLLRAAPAHTTFELTVAADGDVLATCTRFGERPVRPANPQRHPRRSTDAAAKPPRASVPRS